VGGASDPLREQIDQLYPAFMILTPFKTLTWAYQLHYYLCFRTHRRRQSPQSIESLKSLLDEICERHDYHLLACKTYPTQLRLLVSLRPNQPVAKVIQTIKSNTSRESKLSARLWARGYLAQSVGQVRISAVRKYLEQQSAHHGYDSRWLPPVYRYRAVEPVELVASHAVFDLSHHLVLSTRWRKGIFSSRIGQALTDYWLRVAAKRRFAIDQVSTVPDHIHMIVRIVPSMSIEECALLLMNNGQYFMVKNYPQLLIQARVDQLWQASAYAGTCGRYTTGLLQRWLQEKI
jgi:REP element-mobilizing transposase RayT